MKDLPYIDDPETLACELQKLGPAREAGKTRATRKGPRRVRTSLTPFCASC